MRADLNVPLEKWEMENEKLEIGSQRLKACPERAQRVSRRVADDFKIRRALPTIEYLLKNKAKVILISHLGRPKGEIVEELRMKPVEEFLISNFKFPITSCQKVIGLEVKNRIREMKEGEIVLLENLRFHPGEEANDPKFARELAELADFFVNDAFASCHRRHASIVGVPEFLPSYAGFNLEKEVENLSKLTENPKHPLVIILGGAKVFTKMGVIENFKKIADWILLGGALANNFLKAQGYEVGKSLIEPGKIKEAERLLENSVSEGGDL